MQRLNEIKDDAPRERIVRFKTGNLHKRSAELTRSS